MDSETSVSEAPVSATNVDSMITPDIPNGSEATVTENEAPEKGEVSTNDQPKNEDVVDESNSPEEDDYDPEAALAIEDAEAEAESKSNEENYINPESAPVSETEPEVSVENAEAVSPNASVNEITDSSEPKIENAPAQTEQTAAPESDEDDDYDPEANLVPETPVQNQEQVQVQEQSAPSLPAKPEEKPEAAAEIDSSGLKEAYEAVMQSDIVKSDYFAQLSQEKQMEVIQQLLQEKQIALPGGNQAQQSPAVNQQRVQMINASSGPSERPDVTLPMSAEESAAWQEFLAAEEQYLNSGEKYSVDARAFVGNLATNLATKEDLFRLFRRYGDLVEISLKTGYGFAQFKTVEACESCKRGESDMLLHNRPLRLDASHRRKPQEAPIPVLNDRGRERFPNDFQESEPKRRRNENRDVSVIFTNQVNEAFLNDFKRILLNHNLSFALNKSNPTDLANDVRDSAYSGVIAACLVTNAEVDLQVFEETPDGGVKFDEYLKIDPNSACDIVNKAKDKKFPNGRPNGFRGHDRAGGWRKDGRNDGSNSAYSDPRRRGVPEKPGFNQGQRYPQQQPQQQQWQRNNGGYQGRGQNNWDNGSYSGYQGQSNNGFQGNQSGYSQYNQAPGNTQYAGNQQYGAGADPALMQTLQNLDPNTMRSVVALLQQQGGQQGPPAGMPAPQGHNSYQNSPAPSGYPQGSPSAQVNSLLAQLQSQPAPASQFHQQPPQPPQGNAPQQAQPNQALLDMLSRLDK